MASFVEIDCESGIPESVKEISAAELMGRSYVEDPSHSDRD